jgi:hypothetical protein
MAAVMVIMMTIAAAKKTKATITFYILGTESPIT